MLVVEKPTRCSGRSRLAKRAGSTKVLAMMLRFVLCGLFAVLTFCLQAEPLRLDSLQVGSRTYNHVVVIGANDTDLYFTHEGGIANVRLRMLSKELQQMFHYDPEAAHEIEQRQVQGDARYRQGLADEMTTRAQRVIKAAEKAALSSEESLADPISDKSFLGKTAPALEVEKWLGEKPALEGKFVLIAFWEPWSIPSRKAIPLLNALQKKFADKLTVVGVTTEDASRVEGMNDPKIEFPIAIDSKGRLVNALGITSVPYIVLADSKKIVRYEGHPGVVDERHWEQWLGKPATP
jgi:thiol-disulfide isomerase/thioredoxin